MKYSATYSEMSVGPKEVRINKHSLLYNTLVIVFALIRHTRFKFNVRLVIAMLICLLIIILSIGIHTYLVGHWPHIFYQGKTSFG